MQVIFIHHSCFLVEVDDLVLIFDYFGGDRVNGFHFTGKIPDCLLYTSPSPRDGLLSRMPSSA